MTRPITATIVLLSACLLGCGGNEPVGPGRWAISVVSGNAQTGTPVQVLPIPLTVLVTDGSGAGVRGALVHFTVTSGAGTVSPERLGTDEHGLASTTWTLGSAEETQTVLATVFNSPQQADSAVFSATVKPPIISIVSGDNQPGTAGLQLPAPLVIKVTTLDGLPLSGAAIDWTSGGQTFQVSTTNAQGLASVSWTLARTLGTQTAKATVRDFLPSNVTFSATAGLPTVILGYDGASWRTVLADTTFTGVSFNAIWGASASDVNTVGPCTNNSPGMRYDGAGWTPLPSNLCSMFTDYAGGRVFVVGISGNSPSDIFVVVNPPRHSPSFYQFISHYDGQSWTSKAYAAGDSCCEYLLAVWTRAPNDAAVVSSYGRVYHYDGTGWSTQQTGTSVALRGVWGPAVGPGLFAVGDAGTVLYYDGTTWRLQPTGTTNPLYAVWGTSSNDVFAVGGATTSSGTTEATILHYDGTTWTSQTIQAGILRAVWGTSSSSVFAVGDAGTILHYDGASWTRQPATTRINLSGVWGGSATNIFAVGQPR